MAFREDAWPCGLPGGLAIPKGKGSGLLLEIGEPLRLDPVKVLSFRGVLLEMKQPFSILRRLDILPVALSKGQPPPSIEFFVNSDFPEKGSAGERFVFEQVAADVDSIQFVVIDGHAGEGGQGGEQVERTRHRIRGVR